MTTLTAAEFSALTDRDKSLRRAMWRHTVDQLRMVHERRYGSTDDRQQRLWEELA